MMCQMMMILKIVFLMMMMLLFNIVVAVVEIMYNGVQTRVVLVEIAKKEK